MTTTVTEGTTWENIFDQTRVKVLEVKYSFDDRCNKIKYVKDGVGQDITKPEDLFLTMYRKISTNV